jgi:hypothetical protein
MLTVILIALETILLAFTVWLLLVSIKEGRQRDALIMEVGKATRVLTQHEYFITIMDAMMDAEREIIGVITGRMPAGDEGKRTRELAMSIEKLTNQGVSVKYLMPKFQDRLHVGGLYTKAGAEVYYSPCVHVQDFRFTIIDERVALLGVPEATGEKEATRKGYRIPSFGLSEILKSSFMHCMADAITYEQFVRETLKQTGVSPEMLARELKIDEAELKRIIAGG